nr:hypothetical protein [Gammaproteobacteria bacterium]
MTGTETSTSSQLEELALEQVALRPPAEVMRLERMGAFFPTRLSFMRVLLRRLAAGKARVTRHTWQLNDKGFGHAVYTVSVQEHRYSLVAFTHELAPEQRTDRVIAEAWDTTCVLFNGIPDADDIVRLSRQAPRQEAGRFSSSELVLSRANKSVRLFEHVVEALAAGKQPDEDMIRSIGYLQRTTAVYGNGKFGIADRDRIISHEPLAGPFQVELLCVWLLRGFTLDLVEHVARCRSPETFVPLCKEYRRYLGIGNSTGLGMAPFLVSHPTLINNWMMARETAIARVRAVDKATEADITNMLSLLARVEQHLHQWNVADERQMARIEILRDEFGAVFQAVDA